MAFKVFYAWQSDHPNKLCRGLIRRALDQAAKGLNANLEIEDVSRHVQIDQDTQGVAGSPPVAETILQKIRTCDVFVPDLTLVLGSEDNRSSPNPNVLIEYGYALHALGDQRIIGVFNDAFGPLDKLPFDIQHKRWPISYTAGYDSDSAEGVEQRRRAREELGARLTIAIGAAMQTHAEPKEHSNGKLEVRSIDNLPPSITAAEIITSSPNAQYPWDDDIVGFNEDVPRSEPAYVVRLLDGPSVFLELKSRTLGKQLSNLGTRKVVVDALRPLAASRSSGWDHVRNRLGRATFTASDKEPHIARTASLLTRDRQIFGIDRYHLQVRRFRQEEGTPYIPTGAVEEILIDGLANFMKVAKDHLQLATPLEIAAGLEGVKDYCLAVDPNYFGFSKFAGHIFDDSVSYQVTVDSYDADLFDLLKPLFEKIYDAAEIERPEVRTVGRSQR